MRTIILPPSTAELLRQRKQKVRGEWIFPNIYQPDLPMHPEHAYNHLKTLLRYADLPMIRFHDLRHTFATHALTSGVDAKTLSKILGHTNASFTLDIYSHMTDTMQMQAAVNIDRKIGKTNAQMPEVEGTPALEIKSPVSPKFEPIERKIRKSGTGCVYQINDNLWEGSFFPRLPNGTRKKFNIYAKTREECEEFLAEMIKEKKAKIAAEKERLKTKNTEQET